MRQGGVADNDATAGRSWPGTARRAAAGTGLGMARLAGAAACRLVSKRASKAR